MSKDNKSVDLRECECGRLPNLCQMGTLDSYWVKCFKCGYEGDDFKTQQQAIEAWNTRAKAREDK